MTNSERHFTWGEFGLNIHIPEKSLPEGVQVVRFQIKSTITGDFQLPQDTHLVSAIYSIRCSPKCQFTKPLTLEVQHCAKQENNHKLSFIRSTSGSSFHIIEPGENLLTENIFCSHFLRHTSYGFVELDKFCKFGIVQKGTDERLYRANVYRHEVDIRHQRLHFSIVWDSNAHNKVKDALPNFIIFILVNVYCSLN